MRWYNHNPMMWRCQICNITLDEAIEEKFGPLSTDTEVYLDDALLEKKKNRYRWERTQKHGKKTCSKACGWNYTSWSRTRDPKSSYTKKVFTCFCCGDLKEGGRVIKDRRGKKTTNLHICRTCHRKRLTRELRSLWEIFNKEHRRAYERAWQKAHPNKTRKYKRKYLERVRKNKPRLGKTRKIPCKNSPKTRF